MPEAASEDAAGAPTYSRPIHLQLNFICKCPNLRPDTRPSVVYEDDGLNTRTWAIILPNMSSTKYIVNGDRQPSHGFPMFGLVCPTAKSSYRNGLANNKLQRRYITQKMSENDGQDSVRHFGAQGFLVHLNSTPKSTPIYNTVGGGSSKHIVKHTAVCYYFPRG